MSVIITNVEYQTWQGHELKEHVIHLIGLYFTDFTRAGKRKSPYLGLSSIKVGKKITDTNLIDLIDLQNLQVAEVERKILSTALACFYILVSKIGILHSLFIA